MPPDHQPQMLEVEDIEQRQKRLQDILEKLNGAPSTAESSNLSFDFGVRTTFAVGPPTELLARVRQFLPEIEQSNADLLQRDPRSIDMEHIEETDERVVEMARLGIFEQRQTRGRSISISSSGTSSFTSWTRSKRNSSSNLSASNSSSSSSTSDDDDGENEDSSSCSLRLTRLAQKPVNQIIQVLASRNEEESLSEDLPVP